MKGIREQATTAYKRYMDELDSKERNITDRKELTKRKGSAKIAAKTKSRTQKNTRKDRTAQFRGVLRRDGRGATQTGSETTGRAGEADISVDYTEDTDRAKLREIRGDAQAKEFLRSFDLEEKRLRELEAETGPVTSELRTRLGQAGVSVLERARIDALDAERARSTRGGGADPEGEDRYLGATHILIAEVRDRRGPGQYHLSTRLVDVRSGEIVAEVEGERTPPRSVADAPPVDTPYLLKTGRLVVVEFASDVRPRTDSVYRSYPGGYPINLPFSGLIPVSKDDLFQESERNRILKLRVRGVVKGVDGQELRETVPFLADMHTRLGFVDDPSAADPSQDPYRAVVGMNLNDDSRKGLPFDRVPFRDLFGSETVLLDLSKIKSINDLNGNAVPEAHRMRFVVFQVASSILPPAGRITNLGASDLHTVSLGHQSGLQAADRLRVMRPGNTDRLDFELLVREVQDAFARVIYNRDGCLFADRYGPQVGDLVHRRSDRPISLAIPPFEVTDSSPPPPQPARNLRGPAPKAVEPPTSEGQIIQLANELHGKLSAALRNRLSVPLADRSVATHEVEGKVSFASTRRDHELPAHIRVVEKATQKIVLELDFKFTAQEGRSWRP